MIGKRRFYVASDYAGLSAASISAYYGYEKEDADGNWCFEADLGGEKIVIPSPSLGLKDRFDCAEGLLAGLAMILDSHTLIRKP